MKTRRGKISTMVIGALCGIMVLLAAGTGEAGSGDYGKFAAEWWKWVYSIPCTAALCPNPVFDTTGGYGAVGQHGEVWFLAGTFGGTVTRNVSVPEGSQIFFPVVNNAFFNSPNTCGQGPESLSVEEGRAAIAPFIDAAINLSATLDGKPLKIVREQSVVFGVALPKDNLFDFLGFPCTPGIYSPAVDDGYYVLLKKLEAGSHRVHIHAEIPAKDPANDFVTDVTYNLTVVPLHLK
jgi:hypothetical protein